MSYKLYPDGHMTCDTVEEALAWLNAFAKKTPSIQAEPPSEQPKEREIYKLRKQHLYVLALVVNLNPVLQSYLNAFGLSVARTSRALNYLKRKGLVVDTRSGNGKIWKAAAHVSKTYPDLYDEETRKQLLEDYRKKV